MENIEEPEVERPPALFHFPHQIQRPSENRQTTPL